MPGAIRYPYEIRKEADYFGDIPDEKIPKQMLDLAVHIVETKAGHRGGVAKNRKAAGAAGRVHQLMDALRQSAAAERGGASGANLTDGTRASCCARPRQASPAEVRCSRDGRNSDIPVLALLRAAWSVAQPDDPIRPKREIRCVEKYPITLPPAPQHPHSARWVPSDRGPGKGSFVPVVHDT
jgi:hypothetical protein